MGPLVQPHIWAAPKELQDHTLKVFCDSGLRPRKDHNTSLKERRMVSADPVSVDVHEGIF